MTHVPAKQLDKKAVYLALSDPNTFATVLHAILMTTYGDTIYEDDPVSIFIDLEDDFGTKVCEENENKIQAIILATATDVAVQEPDAFKAVAESFCTGEPGIDVLEELTLPEVMWTIFELELNRGPSDFSKSVMSFINHTIESEANDTSENLEENPNDYLTCYLEDRRALLRHQLDKVGFNNAKLPEIQQEAKLFPHLNFL